MKGIDTPESRTRDLVEKQFGKLSKKHLKEMLSNAEQITLISHDKGKFGRILGDLYCWDNVGHPTYETKYCANAQMIEENMAVVYDGQSKEDIEKNHLENRKILQEKGLIEIQGELSV